MNAQNACNQHSPHQRQRAIECAISKKKGREGRNGDAWAVADRETQAQRWWLGCWSFINNGGRNKGTKERQTKRKKSFKRSTEEMSLHAIRTRPKRDMNSERNRTRQQLMLIVGYVWVTIVTWLTRKGREREESEQEEQKRNKRGGRATNRAADKTRRRRNIQRRIQRWNKSRKVKAKDWKKYRHKVRASLQWMGRKRRTEAIKANFRECRSRAQKVREGNTKRRGGAGGNAGAKIVEVSDVERELMRDIGVPQHTWGDGSCWLWAVAGALQKLEGKEAPTETDIRLEKEWRAAIRDIITTHGIPITDEDLRGLGEGVQYTHGKLTRGGTWGGGTEHQALAIHLKVNIIIWDRRYIGRVGAHHRQLYVCTPHGGTYLMNVTDTLELIKQSEVGSIHVLYDAAAKHYEYFAKNAAGEGTEDETGMEMQKRETGKCKEVREREKASAEKTENLWNMTTGEEKTPKGRRIGNTDIREKKEQQGSEINLGTLNISGIAFGYRGKYLKTEEELLKIRPGDKLREVTEMMKTQGISLMTLTDTHLSQENMMEVGKYLQQEGLGGGGIEAKREQHNE
eukprot:5652822-Pleurochrysis_carterae.AAC.1